MEHSHLADVEKFQRKHRRRQLWQRITICLAAVVVFCTTYALILPAITMEKGCQIPEHTHTDLCWTQVTQKQVWMPVCSKDALELHQHSDQCLDGEGNLICGYADFVIHTHDANCWKDDGTLWCPLEEVQEHPHEAGCYVVQSVPIQNGDGNAGESREVDCPLHEHTAECWAEEPVLVCGMMDGDDDGTEEGHQHTEDCYALEPTLTCGWDSDHVHSEACRSEVPAEEDAGDEETQELVLICERQEVIFHAHTDDCFDLEGNLICGMVQVLRHQHSEDCFALVDVPVDTETLTCENTDPDHIHGPLCYGTWVLTCEMEEHVHGPDCTPEDEPEEPELEEPDGTTYFCGLEAHQHGDDCLDENGALICTLPEHTHKEDCTIETPEEVLYFCGKEEHSHTEECFDETGAPICGCEAHQHTEACLEESDRQRETEEALTEQVAALEALGVLSEEDQAAAEDLLLALEEAYEQGQISEDVYDALYSRLQMLLTGDLDAVAESCDGTNWMMLRDSGWFEQYSTSNYSNLSLYSAYASPSVDAQAQNDAPSSAQIDSPGGTNQADDVTVSKTIAGTDLENVFDITLTVQTSQKIDEVISEPDMAVVIVMDISNTMKDNFGGVTRYAAAMEAAEDFLDNFAANNTLGVSKVGYVAFNTDAHQIFGLQSCTNATQANALKNTMRTATGSIINADSYGVSHSRFTNIEGGLKMAQDMLNGVSNKNKFIILLTDGFPTTYLESGYKGYDPYDTTGRFYDHVLNVPCSSGTSYSDEAAIRARNMAASIRNSGTTIFSIGVDVGGQTIQAYIDSSEKLAKGEAKISIVDRTGTTYEIGSATSTEAYKNWLRNSIGSGYYYDSTNTAGLKDAYNQIFAQIKTTIETATKADWVASDPIPSVTPDEIDFIGLYDKDGTLQGDSLTGSHVENAEDTAKYGDSTIIWDLKKSGYAVQTNSGKTIYTYELKYRIRLRNEDSQFVENKIYNTNGQTTLQYRVVKTENGSTTISETKTIEFPIPSVHGYLGELKFTKQDNYVRTVAGAEFTLQHADSCNICRGDGTQVTIADAVETSGEDGTVSFTNIPSGHTYTLTETGIPPGYSTDGSKYTVTVAYDKVTVTATDSGGNVKEWKGTITNNTSYELPNTGGVGTVWYTAAGLLLLAAAGYLALRRRREADTS